MLCLLNAVENKDLFIPEPYGSLAGEPGTELSELRHSHPYPRQGHSVEQDVCDKWAQYEFGGTICLMLLV